MERHIRAGIRLAMKAHGKRFAQLVGKQIGFGCIEGAEQAACIVGPQ